MDAVAALVRARTKNAFGAEDEGTFGDNTRPTADQVEEYIDQAVNTVAARCGVSEETDFCNDALKGMATDLATLRAAMRVELALFPEQTGTDTSAYDRFKAEYDEDITALMEATAEQCGVSGGGSAIGGSGTMPRGGFPESSGVGRQRW